MPGNNDPLFTRVGDVTTDGASAMAPTMTAAAADYTGISANNRIVFTSDPTNGSKLERLRLKAAGTNVAAVMRIYINNGGLATTAANNALWGEISLPATTASTTAGVVDIDYPMNLTLPPGFRVLAGLGAAVAGGWSVIGVGGKY